MTMFEELDTLGANTREGLDRVMGDQDLYAMMLGMFLDSLSREPVCTADFDKPDREELIRRVHTLKGTTGNLSLQPLYGGYMEILALLRENRAAEAKQAWQKLEPCQQRFVECIQRGR